jgi:nitrogen fixation-related uncharacterized protein
MKIIWPLIGLSLVIIWLAIKFFAWKNRNKSKIFDPDLIERWLK